MPIPFLLSALAKLGGVASRAKKGSDEMRNARRRFERQAYKHLREADKAAGEYKKRLKTLAESEFKRASGGYTVESARKKFVEKVKAKTGIDIDEVRKVKKSLTAPMRENYLKRSLNALTKRYEDEQAGREALARELLEIPMVARRIYGATESIWNASDEEGNKLDPSERNQAIMDYFGKSDMLAVIEMFEDEVGGLYDVDEDERSDNYDAFLTAAKKFMRGLTGRGNGEV